MAEKETNDKLFSKKKTHIDWNETMSNYFNDHFGTAIITCFILAIAFFIGVLWLIDHNKTILFVILGLGVLVFLIYSVYVFIKGIEKQ